MSLRFASEHLADLRQDARVLIERAGDQEIRLEAFVAAAEGDLRHAEAAVSHAADDLDVSDVRHLLSAHAERSAAGAAAAKRLLVAAHQQHAAASRLLERLDGGDRRTRSECSTAVLVADDYGDVRDLLTRVLESAGFVVGTAANGLEALIAAYEMRPHVIVMDVSMPVLDGIEATRLIKAGEATRDARIIAYTGNPSFEDSPTRTLFDAVITKPAAPGTVLATVQQVVRL